MMEVLANVIVGILLEHVCQINVLNTLNLHNFQVGFPGSPVVKTPPCNARDSGLIPGQGRSYMLRSN